MRHRRFTKAQIIGMIKEQEAGMPTAEVCRTHGLHPALFYKFKAKYGGMNLSDTECATGRSTHGDAGSRHLATPGVQVCLCRSQGRPARQTAGQS